MNIDNGHLVPVEAISEEMRKSGKYTEVPDKFSDEAAMLMSEGKPVDFRGKSPLSRWGASQHFKSLGAGYPGANRAERRSNAKKKRA